MQSLIKPCAEYNNSFYILTVLVLVLVTFVDILSGTIIISSHPIFESSATLFNYLPFSQMHIIGFQL